MDASFTTHLDILFRVFMAMNVFAINFGNEILYERVKTFQEIRQYFKS